MYKRIAAGIAATLILVSCGGGGGGGPTVSTAPTPTTPPSQPPPSTKTPSAAEKQLGTARFTTHQPRVLEQIGAHHAYARGLTGEGVRIGIDDTIVDYTQTEEFGNRVKLTYADGAVLTYRRLLGDLPAYSPDIARCRGGVQNLDRQQRRRPGGDQPCSSADRRDGRLAGRR